VRQLRNVVELFAFQRVVSALVLSRFDYCNAILAGVPASTLAPLQRVQNAAERLVVSLGQLDHITSALSALYAGFLSSVHRMQYKLCVIAHAVFYKHGEAYLIELLGVLAPVSELPSRAHLRPANLTKFDVPHVKSAVGGRVFCRRPPGLERPTPLSLSFCELYRTSWLSSAYIKFIFLTSVLPPSFYRF
jgi:hypothetical protein